MKKHPLHYINRLAWNVLKKIPRVKTWGDAFRAARRLLRASEWRRRRVALAEHFRALARAYDSQGDSGRHCNFLSAADTTLVAHSYSDFTRRHRIGPSNRAEAVEWFMFGNTRRMEHLR